MQISVKSIKNFVFVNGFLLCVSMFQHNSVAYLNQRRMNLQIFSGLINFCFILFIFMLRNYAILSFIEFGIRNKPLISNDSPKEDFDHEFKRYFVSTTAVETVTHIVIKNHFFNNMIHRQIFYTDLLYFIPNSFLFEVVFDLFHYLTHRLLHSKYLYKYLHKTHHKFKHPSPIIAFYQDPFDLIITNSIPTVLSLCIFPNVSYQQFHVIIVYKMFIEISGHIGRKTYPISSFSQFIWLPRFLHIELYAEDHDLHHSMNNCNYAKRFSLWDKVFHTYKSFEKEIKCPS